MKFKCDISKLKMTDLAVVIAVNDLFKLQSHTCVLSEVTKDGYIFKLKSNLNKISQQRLFADRIEDVLEGYTGVINDGLLVVTKNG